ncbi:MAG: ABC transporter substrate-binding protein [Oscillospiraceae bacterium]|nr:ABC transporter substrate-binding protein [Oscillospiraceae bacterium]
MKKLIALTLAALMFAALIAGCAGQEPPAEPSSATTPASPELAPAPSLAEPEPTEPESEYFIFTDSSGREVELPRNIERITPSGPLAQIVLYTLVPDKLVGLAQDLSETQLQFMDDRFRELPVFGNFYAGTLSLESVMLAGPQVIMDIGQVQPTSADDMQDIQDRTGIPAIFIHMDDIETIISGYATLGELLGAEDQAHRLIDYISERIVPVIERVAEIPDDERATVYYGQNDGLTAVIAGTVHDDVIRFAGGINIAADNPWRSSRNFYGAAHALAA